MNRILATSLLLNLVLVVAIVVVASFSGFFVQSSVLDPLYERQVSVFESFPVHAGDLVFVGDTSRGVLDRIGQVVAGEPGAVVLMIGTFDVLAGVPRRETVARVEEILAALTDARPAMPVMLLSVLPRDVEAVQSVERLNADFGALAEARGVDFLDLAADYRGADGAIDARFSNDGLHLNGAGYLHWRDALEPWLAGVAAAPAAEPAP